MEPGPASSEQCLSFVALQEVQRLSGWQLLVVTVDQEIKASIRQVLSHHTSTPCQPGEAPGVASSLKDCGLEANVGTAQMAQVRLQIPHMFEPGFGPAWVYMTPPYPTLKAAQQDACKTTLAFFLAVNPEAVHLAPGSMKHGTASVKTIRKAAQEIGEWDCGAFWQEARQQVARVRPEPKRMQSNAPVTDRARENALDALMTLSVGSHSASHLPRAVWTTLEAELPQGGLRDFLGQHPDFFEIHDNGRDQELWFTRKPQQTTGDAKAAGAEGEGVSPSTSGPHVEGASSSRQLASCETAHDKESACCLSDCTRPAQSQRRWCCHSFCDWHWNSCDLDSESCWARWKARDWSDRQADA